MTQTPDLKIIIIDDNEAIHQDFIKILTNPPPTSNLDKLNKETDKLWRRGKGAEDGAFTSVGSSMIAWGAGLGIVIALVAILIEQDTGSTTHANSHCH